MTFLEGRCRNRLQKNRNPQSTTGICRAVPQQYNSSTAKYSQSTVKAQHFAPCHSSTVKTNGVDSSHVQGRTAVRPRGPRKVVEQDSTIHPGVQLRAISYSLVHNTPDNTTAGEQYSTLQNSTAKKNNRTAQEYS